MSEQLPRDIAVVGVGALFPDCENAEQFWRGLVSGPHPSEGDGLDCDMHAKKGGADLEHETIQLFALVVADQVLRDAYGTSLSGLDRSRISVILGHSETSDCLNRLAANIPKNAWYDALRTVGLDEDQIAMAWSKLSDAKETNSSLPPNASKTRASILVGRIAEQMSFGGSNCAIDAAGASSLAATAHAVQDLISGASDMVVTGGIEIIQTSASVESLSPCNVNRSAHSPKPSALTCRGLVMFALKRIEDADAAGNRVYAVIKGVGTSSNGKTKNFFSQLLTGQALAIERAYQQAGYSADSVGLMEAHGGGSKRDNLAEIHGLEKIFRSNSKKKHWCSLGAVRSQFGSAAGSTGAVGLFKIVMALNHRILPPSDSADFQLSPDDPGPFFCQDQAEPWNKQAGDPPRRASVSSFGFGGANFHLTLEESPRCAPRLRILPSEIFAFSAATSHDLLVEIRAFLKELAQERKDSFGYLAYEVQQAFSSENQYRLTLQAKSNRDLQKKLEQALAHLMAFPERSHAGEKFYFNFCQQPIAIAGIFSSHFFQTSSWCRELAIYFPKFLAHFQDLKDSLAAVAAEREKKRGCRSDEKKQNFDDQIKLIAVYLFFDDLGLKFTHLFGYAEGELLALYAAGSLTLDGLLRSLVLFQNHDPKEGSDSMLDEQELRSIAFKPLQERVYSSRYLSPYPRDPIEFPPLLARVVDSSSNKDGLVPLLTEMSLDGCEVFLDFAGYKNFAPLVQDIARSQIKDLCAISFKADHSSNLNGLFDVLARLLSLGVPLKLPELWSGYEVPVRDQGVPKMSTVELSRLFSGGIKDRILPQKIGFQTLGDHTHVTDQDKGKAMIEKETSDSVLFECSEKKIPDKGDFIKAFERIQQETARAHIAFQKSMSDAHMSYMKSAQKNLEDLLQVMEKHQKTRPIDQPLREDRQEESCLEDFIEGDNEIDGFELPIPGQIELGLIDQGDVVAQSEKKEKRTVLGASRGEVESEEVFSPDLASDFDPEQSKDSFYPGF